VTSSKIQAFRLGCTATPDTSVGKVGFLVDIAHSEPATRTDGLFVRPFFTTQHRSERRRRNESLWLPRGDWRTLNSNVNAMAPLSPCSGVPATRSICTPPPSRASTTSCGTRTPSSSRTIQPR
jgi:hypothetical protein